MELRERVSRSVYIEVHYNVETGEAERIAVDWTAKGGGSGTSCELSLTFTKHNINSSSVESHLQNQRSAIKMLHERILILLKYVTDVIAGKILNFFVSLGDLILHQDKLAQTMRPFDP